MKPDPLDELLSQPLVSPPNVFTHKVMERIAFEPLPHKITTWLQWVAIAGTVALGIEQVLGFIFGIWLVSSAT